MFKNTSIFRSALLSLFCLAVFSASAAHADAFSSCQYNIRIKDGQYGWVWKPTGAHISQAVAVLPSRFKGFVSGTNTLVVRSVAIYQADPLKKVGTMPMKSNGICAPGGECLDRPTFNHATLSGKALSRRYGQIRLRVVTNIQNHIHCTKPFDPKDRQD
ncbi:MAG: hypothetical protein J0M12_16465 [Deltaproteobacteria bacterium]|nr:hypothetical protein [Deltaproteobacteria bacterium]